MAWKKVSKCSYGSSDDEEVGEAIYILFRPSGGDFKRNFRKRLKRNQKRKEIMQWKR